tara:strand:- start:1883 stop:2662 length:780 start_codon:yes stop_codon:yes gene_type:complete
MEADSNNNNKEEDQFMKIFLTFMFLLTATFSWSAPTHFNSQFAVKPSSVPSVVKAVQDLMASEVGQSMPGGLHLNAVIANGTSPATHEIVFLFPSMTSLANWSMSSRGKPAMQAFQAAMEQHTSPVGELIGSFGKSWGTPSNDDRVWVATRFYTTDAAAVVAALDKLMSDRSMKKFPGNLGISSVSLGNQHGSDMMTHMIFAGYESAEEMENWTDYYTSQPAWGEYLQSLQGVVTWLSTELVQNALVFDGKMDVETFTK